MKFLNYWNRQKIFMIGFHKCGTTSIHRFLSRNRIRSAHFRTKHGHLATMISFNAYKGRPITTGFEKYSAISDLCYHTEDAWIEANRYFKEFHLQHPDALFVFNDRPVENWIQSRARKSGLLDLGCRYFKVGPNEVQAIWRQQYLEHREALLGYSPRMQNFLHYNIESDSPEKLMSFVRRSFRISDGTYRVENRTTSP